MALTSSATYQFNRHFSAGLGIPLYFNHASSTTGTTSSEGLGDLFARLGAAWKGPALNFGTSLTGSAPTGDKNKGLSTGHATFDWTNRVDHDFGVVTPFLAAGLANSVTSTRFYGRPFTSFGNVAHFEGGTDVDLGRFFSVTLSGYDIAPWGNQAVYSRIVTHGAAGPGGTHGRVFETNQQTTGGASLTRDEGFTAGVTANPTPYLELELGYTRSVAFALNTVSFGAVVNVSKLFRPAQ